MHERFFSSHEFSYEKCSEIFPEIFEPLFCGQKKMPGKFPPNFPLNFPNFPSKNQKKFTDELLQERRKKKLANPRHIHATQNPQIPSNLEKFYSMVSLGAQLWFASLVLVRADFWEGDATKHILVKKKGFSVKRREAFSE